MSVGIKRNPFLQISLVFGILFGSTLGCSVAEIRHPSAPSEPEPEKAATRDESAKLLTELNLKIQTLEAKLTSMNDKLDTFRAQSEIKPVSPHPTDTFGAPIQVTPAAKDPENGFTQDEPVQEFRQALILFEGQKYPESILAFSKFLEKYPDHPFAGSAQFYVGESYMKQKEYQLALQEFQRVLTTYDRCPHISDTLKEMVVAEENLKKTPEAGVHKHLLTSLFPASPAALTLRIESPTSPETSVSNENRVIGSHSHVDETPPSLSSAPEVDSKATPPSEPMEAPSNPTPKDPVEAPLVPPTAPIDGKLTSPQ